MDPEAAGRLIDPMVRSMAAAVHKFEGTVARVQGDGIMALFGAPIAHEDHAVRACHAALDLRDAVLRDSDRAQSRGDPEHSVRIGLTTGEVVVRAIRNDLSMDYDAVGSSVHLASRLEQLAVPNSIRLTRETYALAEGQMVAQSLGLQQIRGLSNPIEIFELAGSRADHTRLRGLATQNLMRFVGRDNEYEMLQAAFQRALEGSGQVVGIVGEPGVGKSRLCFEFARSSDVANCEILDTGGVSYRRGAAYLALIGLAKSHFGVVVDDDIGQITDKIRQGCANTNLDASDQDALFALLDLPVGDVDWHELFAAATTPPRVRCAASPVCELRESHAADTVLRRSPLDGRRVRCVCKRSGVEHLKSSGSRHPYLPVGRCFRSWGSAQRANLPNRSAARR